MGLSDIVIRGAREHNLQGVNLTLPREALITITGVSGSGKSSLAFDTLFREGQRRFLESLSAYARQFVGRLEKPLVEAVTGLSPTISIDQKTVNRNPRSTVGTVTEVYDYLRLLFARLGTPHCPQCSRELSSLTSDQMVRQLLEQNRGSRCLILAPVVRDRKGHYRKELEGWRRKGFVRARIDGEVRRLDESIELGRYHRHTIELVLDRLILEPDRRGRLAEAIEGALKLTDGTVTALLDDKEVREFSSQLGCPQCGTSLPELEPRLFSFNSPHGACPDCNGLGLLRRVDPAKVVPDPSLSIRDGALRIMTKTGYVPYVRWGQATLRGIAKKLRFRLDQPWKSLTRAQQKALLYGTKEAVRLKFEHQSASGRVTVRGEDNRPLPGLIHAMENTWRENHPRHLEKFLSELVCKTCEGRRLRPEALAVTFRDYRLSDFAGWTVEQAAEFFAELNLAKSELQIGRGILREVRLRLSFLREVGLDYLTLDRSAASLSGGESQRVRLATQVGAGLQGVLYVLDEPSIGLHARDHHRLLGTLHALRDRRNTVVVVEHDRDTMLASDWLVDIGPGAGRLGGHVVAEGTVTQVKKDPDSATARYLRGGQALERPETRRQGSGKKLRVEGARQFNLKNVTVDVPLGMLVGVTGVSGSGKSTLIHQVLKRALAQKLHAAEAPAGKHRRIVGVEHIDKVIEIDQSPIGRTPRSNPATYTNVWNHIRDLFTQTSEAKLRGYAKGRFSFNVKGGRCESCQGAGVRTIEMQFLADVQVPCDECEGRRFNRETLEITYRGRNVHEILELTVAEAVEIFENVPRVQKILQTLVSVGLDYVTLGQPSTTLSGGEAQRVKLATELARPATGKTLYILDEPTTGLHYEDIVKLAETLSRLVDRGNTVVVIEHNLDVIEACDWLIDLGPEGGAGGGYLVASGTPEDVMAVPGSHTGRFLKNAHKSTAASRRAATRKPKPAAAELVIRGARKNNLDGVNVRIPHDTLTVITGVSGSGKTSLAFDTAFAEGQRRFVESLSTYARRFFSRLERAPIDHVDGLRPAIAIDQRGASRNPRSTVATSTEIYDYLRVLFARVGVPHCPDCDQKLTAFTPSTAAKELVRTAASAKATVTAPLFRRNTERTLYLEKPGDLKTAAPGLRSDGFVRILVDGEMRRLDDDNLGALSKAKAIDLVMDRVKVESKNRTRLSEAIEEAFRRGHGIAGVWLEPGGYREFSTALACDQCGRYFAEELSPRHFSFNHHFGACPHCEGLGRMRRAREESLIEHPQKPLLRGAMTDYPGRYFSKRGSYLRGVLEAAAAELGADLSRPYHKLTARQKAGLMRGDGVPDRVAAKLSKTRGDSFREYNFTGRWRGILGEIEHWLRNAEEGKWWVDRLIKLTEEGVCSRCEGGRLRPESLAVRIGGRGIHEVTRMSVVDAIEFFAALKLKKSDTAIADQPRQEIEGRLRFLRDVGLEYLNLDRSSGTLSGGEAQRIRLAQQLGSGLVGVLYVLDEPSIGLHSRDNDRLIETLIGLRDLGNTILVVEHDEDMIRAADHLLDIGPGAGVKGGRLVASGSIAEIEQSPRSLTGAFLRQERRIDVPAQRRDPSRSLVVEGARLHNLRDVDVSIPLGTLTLVTGVSGSGKSTLVMDVLKPRVEAELAGRKPPAEGCRGISHLRELRQMVVIDQSPIGTTPSSNPATYTKVFDPVREVFATTPEARMKGFTRTRFSFNQGDGRCSACQGRGAVLVEMHFLSDLWVPCEACRGRRYNEETLAVTYKGRNISDVLAMEVAEARKFFEKHPQDLANPASVGRRGTWLLAVGAVFDDVVRRRGAAGQAGLRTGPADDGKNPVSAG